MSISPRKLGYHTGVVTFEEATVVAINKNLESINRENYANNSQTFMYWLKFGTARFQEYILVTKDGTEKKILDFKSTQCYTPTSQGDQIVLCWMKSDSDNQELIGIFNCSTNISHQYPPAEPPALKAPVEQEFNRIIQIKMRNTTVIALLLAILMFCLAGPLNTLVLHGNEFLTGLSTGSLGMLCLVLAVRQMGKAKARQEHSNKLLRQSISWILRDMHFTINEVQAREISRHTV